MKTKIYIVRHTETVGNVEERLTGRQDYELTEKGKTLVKKLTKKLQDISFDKMYASTSKRTVKTIEPLAKINKLNVEEIEDLCEMYFGIFDGWKWEDVNKIQPEIKKNQIKINEISGIPEQEDMREVANRMYNCIEKIAQKDSGKTILICSHGVAMGVFLRKIKNIPFSQEREMFRQYNVALNVIEYDNENKKFEILELANIKYLDEINL